MYHPKALKLYYGLISFLLMMVYFVLSPSSNPQVVGFTDTVKNQFRVGWIQTIGDQSWFSELGLIYDSVDEFYVKSADAYIELVSDVDADADLIYIIKETYYRSGLAKRPIFEEEQLVVGNIPHFMEAPGITNIMPEGWSENTNKEVRIKNQDTYSVIPAQAGIQDQGSGSQIKSGMAQGSSEMAKGESPASQILPPPTLFNKDGGTPPTAVANSTPEGSVAGVTYDSSSWVNVKDAISGQIYCVAVYGGEVYPVRGECPK